MNERKNNAAMWIKQDKNGNSYFNLSVEVDGKKYRFNVFKNNKKENDKHPDFKGQESVAQMKKDDLPF